MDDVSEALNVGRENLISSKLLFKKDQYRDSITMSYFAMHSSAMALFHDYKGFIKSHDGVLRLLSKYVKNGKFSRKSYGYLHDARDLRNKSSYDFSAVFSREEAEEFIEEVESRV